MSGSVMAPARLHGERARQVGELLVTVELDPVADCRSILCHLGLARLTRQLVELADSLRLAVSWAVGDPAYSAATPLVTRSDVAHELAVLGDPNWLGPTAGRTRFARELARRVSHARAAGLNAVALVPRVARIGRDLDLVVKQGVRAVAGVGTTVGTAEPRPLHYGVWELPVSCRLPVERGWWPGGVGWVRRAIRRAARAAATFHLVVDAPALEREGTRAERTVERLLRYAAGLRDRGLLRVQTLGTAAARLSDVPVVSPQRSILRRVG